MWPFRGPNRALIRRIDALEEDLLALKRAHEALRGRFYATRPPDQPTEQIAAPEPSRAASKAEALRLYGPKSWAPTRR